MLLWRGLGEWACVTFKFLFWWGTAVVLAFHQRPGSKIEDQPKRTFSLEIENFNHFFIIHSTPIKNKFYRRKVVYVLQRLMGSRTLFWCHGWFWCFGVLMAWKWVVCPWFPAKINIHNQKEQQRRQGATRKEPTLSFFRRQKPRRTSNWLI